jgi:hypothetical protein
MLHHVCRKREKRNNGDTLALTALLLAACLVVLPLPGRCSEHAFIVSTDYWSTAYYSTIEIDPPRTADIAIEPVSTDPVIHYHDAEDMIFILNRYLADNVQVVDTDPMFTTIQQYSVGNGSNPHDIRVADNTKGYVSRYEWTTLLIVHPYAGDSLGVIDLSPLADADGIPEMDRMEIVDGKLFVTLNNVDRTTWLPAGPGKVAVIDIEADTLVDCDPEVPGIQPITLELPNPYSELRYDRCREELIVACLGAWGVMDGGVEAVDPFALESKGVVITESEIGGDISDAILGPGPKGYAVVLEAVPWPDNFARLVAFDLAAREPIDTLYEQTSGSGSSLAGIEINRQGELYLCDRDVTDPGIRIYDILTDTLKATVGVGVPPFDVAFIQTPQVGVDDDPDGLLAGCYILHQNHPNPFAGSTTIEYAIAPGAPNGPLRIEVFDPLGRLVRTLIDKSRGAGTHSVTWDGTDRFGNPVASGVYFCRLRTPSADNARPMLLLR